MYTSEKKLPVLSGKERPRDFAKGNLALWRRFGGRAEVGMRGPPGPRAGLAGGARCEGWAWDEAGFGARGGAAGGKAEEPGCVGRQGYAASPADRT